MSGKSLWIIKKQIRGKAGNVMTSLLKRMKANAVLTALLCVVVGIVLVVWPGMSMHIVCVTIGIVLIAGGVIRLIGYFTDRDGTLYSHMNMVTGIVFTVVGVWIVIKPEKVLVIIPIIVGILIMIHGANNVYQATELCKRQYDKWWIALILGLITVAFGALLIYKPFAALDTIIMIIGFFLIYDGLSNLWIISRIAKSARMLRQEEEAVEAEAKEVK